ncbi:MAG: TonB-dependent receptor plug domain-containing protein [Phascolarctobacterium sp.]|nr:TonB-dependent receptor plug domain-containing protein [Phascolarctobacterium sp.]
MKKHKNNKRLSLAVAFVLGCLTSLPVFAEEASSKAELAFDLEGITVEAARPDWESKLSPGSVTVIRPDDYKGEQKTLPDLMKKVPGVHVREVNGKGQYTTVTVRGSTAAQVGVFIDGVLSNLGGDAAADLSTIPISNVERVEVYRGYIPARFAGTFIGGVINIVTKKPDKANVNVELGKSSYGGKKGALEIVAPLGDGSLMVGANYESSDGDFKYENYAAKYAAVEIEREIAGYNQHINNLNKENIVKYEGLGLFSSDESKVYQQDTNKWNEFLLNAGNDGFAYQYLNSESFQNEIKNETYYPEKKILTQVGLKNIGAFWSAPEDVKQKVYELDAQYRISEILPGNNPDVNKLTDQVKGAQKRLDSAKNPYRWREYNDYEKINSIVKWQNDNWMVKGAWNKVDRHLPNSLYQEVQAASAIYAYQTDTGEVISWRPLDSRRQKIDDKELLIQNRQTIGDLEWGWMLDYVKSEKDYRAEQVLNADNAPPMTKWSEYNSDKYSGQIDGAYKISDNNMLDFQVNYSYEQMKVDGNDVNKPLDTFGDGGTSSENSVLDPYRQLRKKYDQELLNMQLQDTITLDKKASWQITPSIRYNKSTIIGYSDASRLGNNLYSWISTKDEQSNSKTTWQLALKKKFDDNFTMRLTGGTYYRLLNMYEIAGDGASIVPAPNYGDTSAASFLEPEYGKQFDVSAIWHGKALGADNNTTVTYFWRDSENMLQLEKYTNYFWCYRNDIKGTSNGIELQSTFNWNKFDLDIKATYTNSKLQQKYSTPGLHYDYRDVYATYQPEWEGNVRLTYRPVENVDLFGEMHYMDSYYTNHSKVDGASSGMPTDELLVFNTGIKFKTRNNWQFTIGCNDVFNQGPKQSVVIKSYEAGIINVNPEYPQQGRTYYITAKYSF